MVKLQKLMVAAGILSSLLGCDLAVQAGDDDDGGQFAGAAQPQVNVPEGSPCRCLDLGSNCCATGLFCYAADYCNIKLDGGGCYTEGSCTKKRALGEQCDDKRECDEPLAFCAGPLDGTATCEVSSADLDALRCEDSSQCSSLDGIRRVCSDTYCKRMAGEVCGASNECASNRCYGSTSYRCL